MVKINADAPLFLLGPHKSGTSLLRSLFDGHPELFVVPVEAHFFPNLGYWVDYPFRHTRPERLSSAQFQERVCAWIAHCNGMRDPVGDSVMEGQFDVSAFRRTLSQHGLDSDRERLEAYVNAIAGSVRQGAPASNMQFVEKSVENTEFALHIRRLFPGARLVYIVRNPYSALTSNRVYQGGGKFPLLHKLHRALVNSYYHHYRNRQLLDEYVVVRYEDLVTDTEATMRRICGEIRLEFDPVLLTPTSLGESWQGNSTTGAQFKGVSTSRLDSWKETITPIETALINQSIPHVLRDYDYPTFDQQASPYTRCAGESLRNYAANRLYYKTLDRLLGLAPSLLSSGTT